MLLEELERRQMPFWLFARLLPEIMLLEEETSQTPDPQFVIIFPLMVLLKEQ
jgi:hypothetical protein